MKKEQEMSAYDRFYAKALAEALKRKTSTTTSATTIFSTEYAFFATVQTTKSTFISSLVPNDFKSKIDHIQGLLISELSEVIITVISLLALIILLLFLWFCRYFELYF